MSGLLNMAKDSLWMVDVLPDEGLEVVCANGRLAESGGLLIARVLSPEAAKELASIEGAIQLEAVGAAFIVKVPSSAVERVVEIMGPATVAPVSAGSIRTRQPRNPFSFR